MTTQKPPRIWQDKRLWGAIAAFAILLIAGRAFLTARAKRQAAELEANRPLPVQEKVAALGRVEPAGGVIEVAASEQGVLSEMKVSAGQTVTQGQTLAILDLYEVRLAQRDFAQSQLTEAQQQLAAQQQLSDARIQEAGTRLDQVDLPQAQAVQAQAAEIRDLRSQLDLARIDLDRFESLAAEGAIAQQQLDRQRAEVTQIQQRIDAAQAKLTQLDAARSADMSNADAQLSAAEANAALAEANAGVLSAERNLALAEAQLARTIIRSPINGQVIEVFVDPGERVGEQAVLSVGNTRTMQVVAEVYETDVGLVEVGQRAEIRSRNGAFDEALTGTVQDIALQIFKNDILDDDPAANADARVVEVDIVVDQPEVIDTLTNLQVDVVIDTEQAGIEETTSGETTSPSETTGENDAVEDTPVGSSDEDAETIEPIDRER